MYARSRHAILLRDTLAVSAIVVFAMFAGVRYIAAFRSAGGAPFFYQEMFGPAVMHACGRGFVNPAPAAVPSLDAFLAVRSDTFDCAALPQSVASTALTQMQVGHRYLVLASGMCWRMLGVRWSALDWLTAGLFAITAVTLYLAFRLVVGTTLSAVLTVLAVFSPLHLDNLPHLRDYAKAPFFIIAATGLAWAMSPRRPRRIFAVALTVGTLVGLGIGFRVDVMMYLPPVVFGLLASTPESSTPWRVRLVAAALCISACVVSAWPILRVYSSGENLWHVALLGLMTPYDHQLGIQPSVYEFGDQYRDTYVNNVATSYWMRVHHTPGSDPRMYPAVTGEYYRRLFVTFPADFVTRAWAAVVKSLNLPVDLNVARIAPFAVTARWLSSLYRFRWWVLSWFDGVVPLLLLAVAIGLAMRRWLAAIFLIGFVALSAGVTSLQFQPRHFFHLEMIDYWIFGAAAGGLSAVVSKWKMQSSAAGSAGRALALRAFTFAIAIAAVVVLPIAVLRAYQSRSVSALLTRYDSAATSPVDMREGISNGVAYLGIPPVIPSLTAPSTRMLVTTFDASMCGESIDLTFRYIPDPYGQRDFTRSFHVDAHALAEDTKVFFPAYYSLDAVGRVEFVGLEVPARQRACIRSVSRFSNADAFPLLLTTLLPADWRRVPLYERIDPLESHPSMITPLVGKVWYRARSLSHL
jgi:hypothetical protein